MGMTKDKFILDQNKPSDKTTQHTPGPWVVDGKSRKFIKQKDSEYWVADTGISASYRPTEETEANTRLIAAAPDLLEALQFMLDAFIHVPGDIKGNKARTDIFKYGQGKGGMAEATTKARSVIYAIKKATN